MSTDTETLDAIYNSGERLVPGETHDRAEIVRHKSSYQLFREIIESDIRGNPELVESGITILDIGCGTGHGTYMLEGIIGARIVGIDPSVESIQYAKNNYASKHIEYINCDAEAYVSRAKSFDYVVSRHALEHVENGLNFALRIDCRRRLMVNVPFNESEGNVHHLVHRIKEEHFDAYPNKEFFYEGLDGVTEVSRSEENPPNSIVCISSVLGLTLVKDLIDFPVSAWKPEFLQNLGIESLETSIQITELLSVQKQNLLVEKEAQLENHHANLINMEKDILRREAWIVEKESQLANHEVNLNGIRSVLTEAEGSVQRREAWALEKEEQLTTHEANLRGIEAFLNQRSEQLSAFETDLQRREAYIVEKEAQLLTHEVNLSGIQEDLVQRNQEISNGEQDTRQRVAAISEKEAQLATHELDIFERKAQLIRQSNALSIREESLQQAESGVVEAHVRLAALEKELAELEVDLVRRETMISNSLISKVALKLGLFRK